MYKEPHLFAYLDVNTSISLRDFEIPLGCTNFRVLRITCSCLVEHIGSVLFKLFNIVTEKLKPEQ